MYWKIGLDKSPVRRRWVPPQRIRMMRHHHCRRYYCFPHHQPTMSYQYPNHNCKRVNYHCIYNLPIPPHSKPMFVFRDTKQLRFTTPIRNRQPHHHHHHHHCWLRHRIPTTQMIPPMMMMMMMMKHLRVTITQTKLSMCRMCRCDSFNPSSIWPTHWHFNNCYCYQCYKHKIKIKMAPAKTTTTMTTTWMLYTTYYR